MTDEHDWVDGENFDEDTFGGTHHRFACPECGEPAYIQPFGYDYEQNLHLECPDCGLEGWYNT